MEDIPSNFTNAKEHTEMLQNETGKARFLVELVSN